VIEKYSAVFFSVLTAVILSGCNSMEEKNVRVRTGEYFGQAVPGDSVELFAPGFISTGGSERDASFSPDGKEFYYSYVAPTSAHSVIMVTKLINGIWTSPEVASFSGRQSDLEPFVSPDGKRLFFASKRPLGGVGDEKDWDIWFVDRTEEGWSDAQNIGAPINSEGDEFYPSVTSDGSIYWTGEYEGGFGLEDIYRSKLVDGNYAKRENVGASINSEKYDFNPFVSPDGDLLLFSSFRREDTFGGGDIYLSLKNEDGSWSESKNLGERINSAGLDYCPVISPDGKHLIFSSNRKTDMSSQDKNRNYEEMHKVYDGPQNGLGDLYWVSADILELPNK